MKLKSRFTEKALDSLKPKESRYEVVEKGGDGLTLRVTPNGKKSWGWTYRHNRERKRITYGRYPRMSIKEARTEHRRAQLALDEGRDPAASPGGGQGAAEGMQFEELAGSFLADFERRIEAGEAKESTLRGYRRFIDNKLLKEWKGRTITEIDQDAVIDLITKIHVGGAPIMANRAKAIISSIFSFGMQPPIRLAGNPCANVQRVADERTGKRALEFSEIRTFWYALDQGTMSTNSKLALRLMLATGQRVSEVCNARWQDVKLAESRWNLPAELTKTGVPHTVWLSPIARMIVEQARIVNPPGNSTYVFPSPTTSKRDVFSMTTLGRAVSRAFDRGNFGDMPQFTPRDLRRTVRTRMGNIGIPGRFASLVQNHAQYGMAKTYDVGDYAWEKRLALSLWGEALEYTLGISDLSGDSEIDLDNPAIPDWVKSVRPRIKLEVGKYIEYASS